MATLEAHQFVTGFVGRARSLAALEAAVDEARARRGGLAFVCGEAGIGKTRLAEEVAARASGGGVRAYWGRCGSGEAVPPFWPWVQVIRADAREHDPAALLAGMGAADDIARLVATGDAGRAPAGAPTLDPDQSRFRLYDSLATFLRKVGDVQPSMILLDDLHSADAATLAFLRFFAAEVADMRLLVLATYRDDEAGDDHPLGRLLAELPRGGRRVTLEGLDADEVAALIAATTGVAPAAAVAATVHARSGGNPFFVKELALLGAADQPAVPTGVTEVVGTHLDRVTPACRDLLSAAAVAGPEFDLDVLARAAGLERDLARTLVDEAEVARLVVPTAPSGRYAFAHALVRETLEADLGGAARERLHLAVGRALEDLRSDDVDPPYAELATHFLAALPTGDPEAAVTYAVRSADQATARLAYPSAAAHLAAVADLVPDGEPRLDLLLALGDALHRAGDWARASDTYVAAADLARALGHADGLARAALGLGAGLGGFEVRLFDQRQIDLLEEALAALPAEDSSLRAWVMARLSVALAFVGSEERRGGLARDAVDMARRVGDPAAQAYVLSTYCDTISLPEHIDERLDASTEMVRLAAEAGDRELELLGRRFRVVSLLEVGDIAALDMEIAAFAHLAETLKHPISRWYVALFRGMRALMEGRFDEAEGLARRALEAGERAGSQNARMLADFTQLTEIYRQAGRFDDLDAQYGRFLEAFPPMADMMDWISLLQASVGRGGYANARAELERLAAAGTLAGMAGGGMWIVLTTFLAEAAAGVRHRAAAEVLYDAADGRIRPPSRGRGVLHVRRGGARRVLDRGGSRSGHAAGQPSAGRAVRLARARRRPADASLTPCDLFATISHPRRGRRKAKRMGLGRPPREPGCLPSGGG